MDFNYKQYFIELSLSDIKNAIYLASHEINSKIIDLLDSWDIVLTCYWSDARLDKWNMWKSSIDLLVCNKNELVSSEEIKELLKDFIEKTKDLVIDNSYHEFWINWEVYQVQDEISVWKEISTLAQNDYYIDVLNFDDKLYKYENKTFPDRLIDSYNIYGKRELLLEFKQKMFEDIINSPKILKDFKQDVKSYFKEETIRWKNIRKNQENHFNFDLWKDFWILRYDRKDFFGFKHWPMRALQYKIIEKFISFVIEKQDSSLIKDFPFSIEKRLMYFKNKLILWLNSIEYSEIIELYKFFRDMNEQIHNMTLSKKYTPTLFYLDEIDAFIFTWRDYEKVLSKLDRFLELFQKLD